MKLSTIFRLTRERMELRLPTVFGNSPYICDNIRAVGLVDKADGFVEADYWRAKAIISTRIEGQFCVARWLFKHGHITANEYWEIDNERPGKTFKKMKAYRIAWLRELEAEFLALGD